MARPYAVPVVTVHELVAGKLSAVALEAGLDRPIVTMVCDPREADRQAAMLLRVFEAGRKAGQGRLARCVRALLDGRWRG